MYRRKPKAELFTKAKQCKLLKFPVVGDYGNKLPHIKMIK